MSLISKKVQRDCSMGMNDRYSLSVSGQSIKAPSAPATAAPNLSQV